MKKEELSKILNDSEMSREKKKNILKDVKEKIEKEKTMKISIKEASAASVMSGLGNSYITPYALALNANNAQIGFLTSFVSLVSPFSQAFGSKLMEKISRKKIIVNFILLQALMWIPIIMLSLFFWRRIFTSYLPIILIVFYSIYAIFGSIATPSWFSLMGDIIPEKIRGRYFAKRNRIAGAVALISMIIGAFILDSFKTRGLILVGFSVIFLLAFIFRIISVNLLKKHHDIKLKLQKGYFFSLWQFVKKAPSNNFGKFVIYVSLMNLATAIASPFFTVYMLKDLGFSYITFMLISISASISSIIFMPILGKFSDRYGNRELLKLGSILIPMLPILWLFSSSPYYLAFVPQIIGGFGWAAFNLAAGNFIYDSVTPQRRGLCVAYFNIFNGVGIFIGASLGGLLAQYLTIAFMNKLLFIFLISGFFRFVVVSIILHKIKEVRTNVKPKTFLLYFKEIVPVKGMFYEIVDELSKIKSKIKKK